MSFLAGARIAHAVPTQCNNLAKVSHMCDAQLASVSQNLLSASSRHPRRCRMTRATAIIGTGLDDAPVVPFLRASDALVHFHSSPTLATTHINAAHCTAHMHKCITKCQLTYPEHCE